MTVKRLIGEIPEPTFRKVKSKVALTNIPMKSFVVMAMAKVLDIPIDVEALGLGEKGTDYVSEFHAFIDECQEGAI